MLKFVHSPLGRLLRIVVGFALVIWSVNFALPATFLPSIVGTTMMIYAMADWCLVEQIAAMWGARQARRV